MDELIRKKDAIDAVEKGFLAWSAMPKWREEKIIESVKAVSSASNMMTRTEVYQLAINTYGNKNQQAMMIEEMSELTKAISKYWRNPGEEEYTNVLEEMADVEIMLEQMKMIFGKTDEFVWQKTGRLAKRLKGETNEN